MTDNNAINNQFAEDLRRGLNQKPKRLYSKYFYDEIGDKLFQDIMNMEEYYLTKSEFEIISTQKNEILNEIYQHKEPFQLIEFEAGDGLKTKVLLKYFEQLNVDFEYVPIDISEHVLSQLTADLSKELPNLKVNHQVDTYIGALEKLSKDRRKVILFMGSNVGNFSYNEAIVFLTKISEKLNKGDRLIMGVDLKKHPEKVLAAYNDKNWITRAFNLNLLNRINKEFHSNFDLTKFDHYPTYDPISGETKSYLISQTAQTVFIKDLNMMVELETGEPIFMEISKKYSLKDLEQLAKETGFKINKNLLDCKHYFVDTIWEKNYEGNLE